MDQAALNEIGHFFGRIADGVLRTMAATSVDMLAIRSEAEGLRDGLWVEGERV